MSEVYTGLYGSGVDTQDNTVSVGIKLDDDRGMQINMTPELATQLAAVLSAEAGKLSAANDGQDARIIPLYAQAILVRQTEDAQPLLVFKLIGGAPLALQLGIADYAALAAEMALLAAPKGTTQ